MTPHQPTASASPAPFTRADLPAIPDVRRIAVLRGGGLGDLLVTLPAVRALKDRYPAARLTLLGTPAAARLLAGRPGPVNEVLMLPVAHGVHEPDGAAQDPAETERFFAAAGGRRFDLAVQLHGGGRYSNPFLGRLGARVTVGGRTDDAVALDRWLPYRYYQHETLRALEVVGLAGAPATELEPRLAVLPGDRAAGARALAGLPATMLAVHPGATDPRRRWPPERFAAVAAAAARQGAGVAVLGTAGEAALVARVAGLTRRRLPAARRPQVRALAGTLDEPGLVGVLAVSTVLLGNDSGPRHLAAAVGTPTVAVYWVGNVINAGPFTRHDHRVHVAWIVTCPVCGRPCGSASGYQRCPHDVSFVSDVATDEVAADVLALLAAP
jgi:ADP-heptose:LPS heptosyltransferase